LTAYATNVMTTTGSTQNHACDIQAALEMFQRNAFDKAAHICHQVLRKSASHPGACHLLGMISHRRHDPKAAQAWMLKSIQAAPGRADIVNDFGLILMADKKLREAIIRFEQAIQLNPQMAEAHFNKGLASKAMGDTAAALSAFREALACNATFSKAHFCIGDLLLTRGDHPCAEHHFRAAIGIAPGYTAAYNHLAICLSEQGRLNEAVQLLTAAHNKSPRCANTLCNLGNLMRKLGRFDEAARMYRAAIARRPEFVEAHFNLSLVLLLVGNFKEGWQEYQWRLKHFKIGSGYPHRHGLPLWTGQPLAGKAILIYDEQGYGDIFMFCRFLKDLKAMQATVIFEVRKELFEFFEGFPWVDEVVLRSPDLKPRIDCDYCLPLLSLPHLLGVTRDNIHAQAPYLAAKQPRIAQWSPRIAGAGFRIGLVWRGSDADPARRLDLTQLQPLSLIPGISWYGLQKEAPGEPSAYENATWLSPIGRDLIDFSDTAAVIAHLDLVISIDTAVAHLAAAMGKPVWVLLPFIPDWRWFLDTPKSPWYETMRLFRQPAARDWRPPVLAVADALQSLVEKPATDRSGPAARNDLLAQAQSFRRNGDHKAAWTTCRRILSDAPDCHAALFLLGLLDMDAARYAEAVVFFEQALSVKPEDPICLNNLGLAHHRLGQLGAAEAAFQAAIASRPDFITACCNLGNLYLDLNLPEKTIHWYRQALELNPADARAQTEMGKLYLNNLDPDNACLHFQNALNLDPQCTEAAIALATTTLLKGDFDNGWNYYRNRFKHESTRRQAYPYEYCLPLWQGEAFPGRKLIVHSEQGFGDTIQFARFLPAVKARGGHVTFQVQPPLRSLFSDFPGTDALEPLPQVPPQAVDADLYVPLMDLPACLNTTLETIPAPQPYLVPHPAKMEVWRHRMQTNQLKVGLVWAGNRNHRNDHRRSCRLKELNALSSLEGVQLYSLQKEVDPEDAAYLESQSSIIQLGHWLEDFSDTAAALDCLDLVVSVDTAVAHLAGAMAKPVWLLLPYVPDWRWMLERTDSPWYPSMRLFRQGQAGRWQPVIDAVQQELISWLNRWN
jgi:tetratricopeptide (TPR) repeat protein